MNFDLSYVQHDPAHCTCPGLFRSFMRGQGDQRLDIEYDYGDLAIQILGPNLLGASDLWVLQGLIALACNRSEGTILLGAPKTELGTQIAFALEPKGAAKQETAVVVKGLYAELAREMGYAEPDSNSTREILKRCIKRLYSVTIFATNKVTELERGYRLLADYTESAKSRTFAIGLNPMIAAAVAGSVRYIRIPMDEVRQIKRDTTRLMHQRLCAFINEGATHPTPIDQATLCGYIWHFKVAKIKKPAPKDSDAEAEAERINRERLSDQSTERSRRMRLRESIDDMKALGWTFNEVAKGKYHITRSGAASPLKRVSVPVKTGKRPR